MAFNHPQNPETRKRPHSQDFSLQPIDNSRLASLCGPLDENLRQIESALDVLITHRSERFTVAGPYDNVVRGVQAVQHFYDRTANRFRRELTVEDIQTGLITMRAGVAVRTDSSLESKSFAPEAQPAFESTLVVSAKRQLAPRNAKQAQYIKHIQAHDVTFGVGPAGTGKTYLAVACAVDAFERDLVKRIVLCRPAVEAGEKLGFLPGDLSQKVDPYLRPLYDALFDLMGYEKVNRLFERTAIEVAPLAFMRGRTLNNAFIILDEAQNTTPEQMKMFLTRLGYGSKAVITGDVTQVDLPRGSSGLVHARQVLSQVKGIGFSVFQSEDVVRHPLVQHIVDAYDRNSQK
jgi:phosphate starvation-inducible protein PhoH and related proteins